MRIENLTLSFGVQDVFRNINLNIKDNQKVGIVGVNGAGKTTFLKVILGELEPDSGRVVIENTKRVSLLPQVISDEVKSMNISVLDYLQSGRPIAKIEAKIQREYAKIATASDEKEQAMIFKNIDKLQRKLESLNYKSADTDLLKIIYGMKIDDNMLDSKLKEISGGQKSKIAFARLLYSNPDIMLLDEPTNHLDETTKDFVINYLKSYRGSVYVISHDIEFLNAVTNTTLFLDKRTKSMELYEGNYDRFLKLHREREENIKKNAEKQDKEIKKLEEIVNKYSNSSGKRKKMAQDREKKLDKLLENKIDIVKDQKNVKMDIEIDEESSKEPLRVENLCFKYDKNKSDIIHDLSFNITRGEKFLIVGENGIGKSTLLKLIVGKLKPNSGKIIIGNKTTIGYYAQEHEILKNDKDILENFSDIDVSTNKLRAFLGRFLFYGDDVYKKIDVLSPGERSRVALAKIALSGANFLILDEPTNHLDPATQNIIRDTFKDYKGTMLIVSHNPEFVDNLGIERILVLPSGKIEFYDRKTVEYYENLDKK